jgi:5'-deoxynucleotidase YfbR-like HD superfamily hydrolase
MEPEIGARTARSDQGAGQRRAPAPAAMTADERRLLATMPLHAITALHGEAGLRERFALEIAGFPGPGRLRIERALELAARLHAPDRRQREPYVDHLLRVAIRIITYYQVRDADVICAALLHDAVEDHAGDLAPGGGQPAALEVIAAQFGPRVAQLVGAVTNPEFRAGRDKHQQYREHVAASLEASPWARVIKASDFTDNGVGLIHTTGPRLQKLADKYAPLVPVLAELIARPDTPLSDDAKTRILTQLDRARQRFAAIKSAPDCAEAPSQGE